MIPNNAHFLWFGNAFPFVYYLALHSAKTKGLFDKVILHHADDLSQSASWPYLEDADFIEQRKIDPAAILEPIEGIGGQLLDRFLMLEKPAAKTNMLRAAILYNEGGVYLDTDTLTIREVSGLLDAGVFCGQEHIVLPYDIAHSKAPVHLLKIGAKLIMRDIFRRLPKGYRSFRHIERWFPVAVNNAVLGGEAGHPFLLDLLERMAHLDKERLLVRFALGTHLLQRAVKEYRGEGLKVHPPCVFYPLAPEISEHWFQTKRNPALTEVVSGETRIVHWYASVRMKSIIPQVDAAYLHARKETELFSRLAFPIIRDGDFL